MNFDTHKLKRHYSCDVDRYVACIYIYWARDMVYIFLFAWEELNGCSV